MGAISRTLATQFRRLLAGESVAASALRREVAEELIAEGLLTVRVHGSHRSFSAIDVAALSLYISDHYPMLALADRQDLTRSDLANVNGDSKQTRVRACPGFPINSYMPIECQLAGKDFLVSPIPGSFLFVDDWKSFVIPEDVLVVGIENMENFRLIRRQRYLFDRDFPGRRILFVSRYPQSADLHQWLETIPNSYLHFGDFDLEGISIFLTEFHRHLGDRATFYIPEDIEQRIVRGSLDRYNTQYPTCRHLTAPDPRLQNLVDLIHRHHRTLDQEAYIK
ncbi:MAG: hypothetical protein ACI4AK_07165 [Lepagella sp.]